MSEIPADVMSAARGCVCAKETSPSQAPLTLARIARAIMAERERCAAILESKMYDFGCIAGTEAADFATLCGDLAAAIRAPPE